MTSLFSRTSISILALLSASSAFALNVGDSVTMEGAVSGDSNVPVMTQQTVLAYDADTNVYTISQSQTLGDQVNAEDAQVSGDDIFSDDVLAMLVGECEAQGFGASEHVTVPAGEFDTCRITAEDGSIYWVGQVPFGLVKFSTKVEGGTADLGATKIVRAK